jgi:hypothetical protein
LLLVEKLRSFRSGKIDLLLLVAWKIDDLLFRLKRTRGRQLKALEISSLSFLYIDFINLLERDNFSFLLLSFFLVSYLDISTAMHEMEID